MDGWIEREREREREKRREEGRERETFHTLDLVLRAHKESKERALKAFINFKCS